MFQSWSCHGTSAGNLTRVENDVSAFPPRSLQKYTLSFNVTSAWRCFRAYVWKYPMYEGGDLDYRLQAYIIVLWIRRCIILNILLIYFLKSRPFIFQGSTLSFKLIFGATPLWFDKIIIFSMFKELFFFDKPASVGEKALSVLFCLFLHVKI